MFHVAQINPVNLAVGILNCCFFFLFFCVVFIKTFFIFFLSRIPSSLLRVGCKALWHEFDMHSNVKIPPDVTWLHAGSMGFVPTSHWPIKSQHFYQAQDNILLIVTILNVCKARTYKILNKCYPFTKIFHIRY